jgi:hypothetical protein
LGSKCVALWFLRNGKEMAYELSDYQSISKAMEVINKTNRQQMLLKDKLSCSYAFIQYFFLFDS